MLPKKIIVFEDNHSLRNILIEFINTSSDFICVGSFSDSENIVQRIGNLKPDLILMDIELARGTNGIEGVRIVKEHFPKVKILMQTVFSDNDCIFQALKAGADGYWLKNESPEKLLVAMNDVMAGGAPMTPSIAFKVLEMFRNPPTNPPTTNEGKERAKLTDRQKEVLECLMNGLTYAKTAENLFISIDTVRFHVTRIYELLHVKSKYELILKYRK